MPKYMTYDSWLLAKKEIMNAILENAFNVDMVFPVGSVITNSSPTFNPNTLYEGTTWERIKGKVIVGIDESDSDFNAVNKTGGEKSHTLTVGEMPSHTHTAESHTHSIPAHRHGLNSHTHSFSDTTSSSGSHTHSASSSSAGSHTHKIYTQSGNRASLTGSDWTQQALKADEKTGDSGSAGSHSHTITVNSGGSHTHSVSGTTGAASGSTANSSVLTSGTSIPTINSTGGGGSHNNLQPYITKYVWERTA